ncbi:hypothetical protein [Streptomyces sp. NPDC048411]|uniref:hypothetical protein n=1 Tax=Streptomyces sp. NPDC048411 TaxID=3157206 RepID=UPI003456AB4D
MPIHPSRQRSTRGSERPGVQQAEAALVEHYPRLVRLAYLVLPPSLGRHRRVLAAHAAVQRALPGRRTAIAGPPEPLRTRVPAQGRSVPSPRKPAAAHGATSAYAWVRLRVLRTALAYERRPRWWPARIPAPASLRPALPFVRGLRLFPRAGGAEELALGRTLSTVSAAVRAAFTLRLLEELTDLEATVLLARAGASDAAGAVRAAGRLESADRPRTESLLRSAEFDPCTLQTRPSDLLRRRHRLRAVASAAALCVMAGGLVVLAAENGPGGPARAGSVAVDPAALLRTAATEWADTSRVDFTAWPARGDRTQERDLLGRALRTWGRTPRSVHVSTSPGTLSVPPAQPPRLLYAGEVDGAAVVLFHDGGVRVVRYAEPLTGAGAVSLDFARTDDADVTTGAAVVISRRRDRARFLLAPWVSETTTRDLLAPNAPARSLKVGRDGVTAPVSRPSPGRSCGSWPVMQLRSSERIAHNHSFLLTDLGDLAPVHLTYTPLPRKGASARGPREATGGPALLSWARTVCSLRVLRGSGVRAVNNWAFARQPLPEGGTPADWVCTRADTWQGPGRVLVQFLQPAASLTAPGAVVADRPDTALCSRFGQHVLAGTHWRAPSGRWYVLAAGSRAVNRIEVTGGVRGSAGGTTLAVRAPQDAQLELKARLRKGGALSAVR